MGNRIGSGWSNNTDVFVDGVNPRGNQSSMVRWNGVGPDFCHVLGIRLLVGRDFTDADSATAPKVAIINETFAKRYLAGRNPIGHQMGIAQSQRFTIVGVVADSKYSLSCGSSNHANAWNERSTGDGDHGTAYH